MGRVTDPLFPLSGKMRDARSKYITCRFLKDRRFKYSMFGEVSKALYKLLVRHTYLPHLCIFTESISIGPKRTNIRIIIDARRLLLPFFFISVDQRSFMSGSKRKVAKVVKSGVRKPGDKSRNRISINKSSASPSRVCRRFRGVRTVFLIPRSKEIGLAVLAGLGWLGWAGLCWLGWAGWAGLAGLAGLAWLGRAGWLAGWAGCAGLGWLGWVGLAG